MLDRRRMYSKLRQHNVPTPPGLVFVNREDPANQPTVVEVTHVFAFFSFFPSLVARLRPYSPQCAFRFFCLIGSFASVLACWYHFSLRTVSRSMENRSTNRSWRNQWPVMITMCTCIILDGAEAVGSFARLKIVRPLPSRFHPHPHTSSPHDFGRGGLQGSLITTFIT